MYVNSQEILISPILLQTMKQTLQMGPSTRSAITEEEIKTTVRKVKNGKAPGYDNVVNEHISSSLAIFLHVYMIFF